MFRGRIIKQKNPKKAYVYIILTNCVLRWYDFICIHTNNKKDYLSKYIVRKYLTKTITNIILLHFEDNLLVILLRKCQKKK